MEEKYINFILNKCIHSKSKSIFLSYDKVNKKFINKLIKGANKLGYNEILVEETDASFEHELLTNLSVEEIKKHPYFNSPLWNKAAEEKYIFLMASTKFPSYFDDIPNEKLIVAEETKSLTKKRYMDRVAEDSISWTIFGLSNNYWANSLFPDEDNPNEKLENLIYSFCMLDTSNNENSFDNYLRIENKKINYLNNLEIKELKFLNDLGTNLTIGLVDNYIFRALEENHCIENLPTYSVWTMPHKTKVNGKVYGSLPITNGLYLIEDYWFLFENGLVIDYDATVGKEYLDNFFSKDEAHKRLGEIAIIDSNSPIARTKKVYNCNLFDENISTHLAFGMAYKNTIKNGILMNNKELDQNGCNICSGHLDFTIGTDTLSITAVTKDLKEIEIYSNGNFNYQLIEEKSPFINREL